MEEELEIERADEKNSGLATKLLAGAVLTGAALAFSGCMEVYTYRRPYYRGYYRKPIIVHPRPRIYCPSPKHYYPRQHFRPNRKPFRNSPYGYRPYRSPRK